VSPTSTSDLADQIVRLSRSDAFGLYHATGEGQCSWYEFARELFAITDSKVDLLVAAANEFPAKVPRPNYSVLENKRLKLLGLNCFGPWQDALRRYVERTARVSTAERS
jgi:dTDP-4-dehydrorhamnose reductase